MNMNQADLCDRKNDFVILAFGTDAYTSRNNFWGVMVLSTMFCLSSISLIYNIEKWFVESSMGQVGALSIFVLLGSFFLIVTMCLDFLWWIPHMRDINRYLSWIFAFLPSYTLAIGLIEMCKYEIENGIKSI